MHCMPTLTPTSALLDRIFNGFPRPARRPRLRIA